MAMGQGADQALSGSAGAGIDVYASRCTIEECSISNNQFEGFTFNAQGQAICGQNKSNLFVVQCTITGHQNVFGEPALHLFSDSSVWLFNDGFADNTRNTNEQTPEAGAFHNMVALPSVTGTFDCDNATWYIYGMAPFQWGPAGALPFVGDWDGDGRDGIGCVHYDANRQMWDWFLRNTASAGPPDAGQFSTQQGPAIPSGAGIVTGKQIGRAHV